MTSPSFQLLASGSNGQGQLGIGHLEDVSLYTPCHFHNAVASTSQLVSIGRVVSLASGSGHSLLLAEEANDGGSEKNLRLWATGSNEYGQLGPSFPSSRGNPTQSWTPLGIEELLRAAGLGRGNQERYEPKIVACSWTTSFICFSRWSKSGGEWQRVSDIVLSFGTNDFGELGRETGAGKGKEREGSGRVRWVQLRDQGKEIGGWTEVTGLKASQRHVVAITRSDDADGNAGKAEAWGWGAARHGQLDVKSRRVFRSSEQPKGKAPPGSADKVETNNTNSPKGIGIEPKTSSAGGKTPGRASSLSDSSKSLETAPALAKLKPRRPDNPYSKSEPTPVEINLSSRFEPGQSRSVADFSLGATHTVFLLDIEADGKIERVVAGLGNGAKGQLSLEGLGDSSLLGCTWNGTYLGEGSEMRVTGSNTHGQLGIGSSEGAEGAQRVALGGGRRIAKLVCGSEHILLLADHPQTPERELWTWGWNEHGNLGLGDAEDRWEPVRVPLAAGGRIVDAWAGCGSSWILLST